MDGSRVPQVMRPTLALLAALAVPSLAPAAVLDFETVALAGEPYRALRSPVRFENVSGSGVTVTVLGSTELRVYDLARYGNDGRTRGQALIDWPWSGGAGNNDGTTFVFSRPVASVSVTAGDWSSDDDGPLALEAYDCQGRRVATDTAPWSVERNPPFARLTVEAPAICRVVYRSGGPHPGSTFVDEVRFELAPAPPAVAR